MRTLILGGTAFLSFEVAREARRRGHDVTCLARGTSTPPPDVSWVRADRDDGASAYCDARGEWDDVVDVSSNPLHVRDALHALAERARHWTYVSSCSVYASQDVPDDDEDAELLAPLAESEPLVPERYGEAKVAGEQACARALADRLHVCRAGLIGGPGDRSDRFGYWPARFARGVSEEVLVPDAPTAATQTIDVRDLARWIVDAAEQQLSGAVNAVGDTYELGHVLDVARQAAAHTGVVTGVDESWLVEHGVASWAGEDSLPLWIEPGVGFNGFARRSRARATTNGLRTRPLDETIAATLTDERARGLTRPRLAGLRPTTEQRLLAAWRARGRG